MIDDDVFVVDAVAHGLHFAPENQVDPVGHPGLGDIEHRRVHQGFSPVGRPEYVMAKERWLRSNDADVLAHALFAESWTDFAVYHGVPQYGVWKDGGSPFEVGREMRRRWPHRVALYGDISPWWPDVLERLERLVVEDGVVGIKLYPADVVNGRVQGFKMNDRRQLYPIYEKALELGLRVVAVHKAIPLSTFPSEFYRVDDVEEAAADFPELIFEVVHGGAAFLDETAMLLARFENVVVNLEGTCALPNQAPKLFAEILAKLLRPLPEGERILWGTGVTAVHPQPILEHFWTMEMPEEMLDGWGYRPLTREMKRNILGLNAARMLGLDIEALRREHAQDEFAAHNGNDLAPPWSAPKLVAV